MAGKTNDLEDVALLPPERDLRLSLDDVGLAGVAMQVRLHGQLLPARGTAGVSLINRDSRGIHMSRIFKVLTEFGERDLTWEWMNTGLDRMLETHKGLSDAAYLAVEFDQPVLRKALLSSEHGWRTYPVSFRLSDRGGERHSRLTLRVLYSSTCPCSAALSRQALRDRFAAQFGTDTIERDQILKWLAETSHSVPHSQRSEATVTLTFHPGQAADAVVPWIDRVEETLATPVQAAVKREDEQEFARLNAQNLMFCEDAARRLKAALLPCAELADFEIEVRHYESLHAHDVIARASKVPTSFF